MKLPLIVYIAAAWCARRCSVDSSITSVAVAAETASQVLAWRHCQRVLTTLTADAASRAAFDLESGGHRVYVVDPEDRIILRYASDADPRGILKDMERLLRYAWAG